MKRSHKRNLVGLGGVVGLFSLASCFVLPDFAGQHKAGKYEPVAGQAQPNDTASQASPEEQTEPHTCGLHAMRSLYKAYGLEPDTFRLRFRLGTDQPAMRADKESTGTLHPDLYRVLAQDGFTTDPIDLESDDMDKTLDTHLLSGQLALAVVYRTTYHWVLLSGAEPSRLTMIDSLASDPESMTIDQFQDTEQVLSITLVQPIVSGVEVSASDAHLSGFAEMRRLYQRK